MEVPFHHTKNSLANIHWARAALLLAEQLTKDVRLALNGIFYFSGVNKPQHQNYA